MSREAYLVSRWAAGAFQTADLRCSDTVDFGVTCASVWKGGLLKGGPWGCSNTTVVRWCTMVWRRTGSIWAQAAAQPGQSFHSLKAAEEKRGLRAQSRSCFPLLRLSLLILPPSQDYHPPQREWQGTWWRKSHGVRRNRMVEESRTGDQLYNGEHIKVCEHAYLSHTFLPTYLIIFLFVHLYVGLSA